MNNWPFFQSWPEKAPLCYNNKIAPNGTHREPSARRCPPAALQPACFQRCSHSTGNTASHTALLCSSLGREKALIWMLLWLALSPTCLFAYLSLEKRGTCALIFLTCKVSIYSFLFEFVILGDNQGNLEECKNWLPLPNLFPHTIIQESLSAVSWL